MAKEELQRFVGPDITVEKLLEIAAVDIEPEQLKMSGYLVRTVAPEAEDEDRLTYR